MPRLGSQAASGEDLFDPQQINKIGAMFKVR
jgi:hypothetical protein